MSKAQAPSIPSATPVSASLDPNAILTPAECAAWLRVHPRQLARLGVPCLALGWKTKRYRGADVIAWLAAHGPRPKRKAQKSRATNRRQP